MRSDANRKQKKRDKNKNRILSEIEKEALHHSEATIIDEHVRAKHAPEENLVAEEVINQIVSNSDLAENVTSGEELSTSENDKSNVETVAENEDIDFINLEEETNHINFEHNDISLKHIDIKKHEFMILVSLIGVLLVLFFVSLSLNSSKTETIDSNNRLIDALNLQLENEKLINTNLQANVDELNLKVTALSESVAAKTEEVVDATEELRLLKLPAAYPLKGTAAIIIVEKEDDNATEDIQAENAEETDDTANDTANNTEENLDTGFDEMEAEDLKVEDAIDFDYKDKPYTLFSTGSDTKVVATGLGKVVAIEEDSEFGYAIKIDHQNGYYSIYRGYGVPQISIGDTVSSGCILMSIAESGKYFLYQIIYEGSYVDPMGIMEING